MINAGGCYEKIIKELLKNYRYLIIMLLAGLGLIYKTANIKVSFLIQ